MAILTVSGLQKSFNGKQAVKDISFSVTEGEVLGLLGPNGAGKTTAIRSILGIYQPDAGEISLADGLTLDQLGYLPEERGLYPDAKVLDCLVFLAALKSVPTAEARERALHWLERVELQDYAHQKIETLSKGMQQKIQFIASVIHRPVLAVLDEAFSGLDPVNQEAMIELFHDLKREGTTMIVSSHQINLVENMCDRIILIEGGEIILQGEVDTVKRAHGVRLIKMGFEGDAGFLKNLDGVNILHESGHRLTLEVDRTWTPKAFMQLVNDHLEVDDISISWPPLHDVFVSTVRARRGQAS